MSPWAPGEEGESLRASTPVTFQDGKTGSKVTRSVLEGLGSPQGQGNSEGKANLYPCRDGPGGALSCTKRVQGLPWWRSG